MNQNDQTIIGELADATKKYNETILSAYPIGSIYISVNNTNPSTLFGGKWEQIKDRFLLAAGGSYTGGATGGEERHKLTIEEMPAHNHPHSLTNNMKYGSTITSSSKAWTAGSSGTTDYYMGLNISSQGGSQAHNNMPPYLAVYMWKRIS